MDSLNLNDDEIWQISSIGRRFLINEGTHPDDLKVVLMERLREMQPALADKIGQMDEHQLTSLRRTMLARQQLYS